MTGHVLISFYYLKTTPPWWLKGIALSLHHDAVSQAFRTGITRNTHRYSQCLEFRCRNFEYWTTCWVPTFSCSWLRNPNNMATTMQLDLHGSTGHPQWIGQETGSRNVREDEPGVYLAPSHSGSVLMCTTAPSQQPPLITARKCILVAPCWGRLKSWWDSSIHSRQR